MDQLVLQSISQSQKKWQALLTRLAKDHEDPNLELQRFGQTLAVRALKQLLKVQSPDIVFLSETKLCESDPNLKSKLCNDNLPNYNLVNCAKYKGKRSGGLAMLWSNDVNLTVHNYNTRFIDCYIFCAAINFGWYATGIYGFSIHNEKHKTCDLINSIRYNHNNDNWLLFGDFNMVLSEKEKIGGNPIDYHLSDLFNNTLNVCSLVDLGFKGDMFTWANNQADTHHLQERLDRFLATPSWIDSYPNYCNNNLLRYASDHCPLLLDFWPNNVCRYLKRDRYFPKFEQLCLQNSDSNQIVKTTWSFSKGDIINKMKDTLSHLHSWGKETFGDIPKKISNIQKDLNLLKSKMRDASTLNMIKVQEQRLDDLLKEEELWWAQREKIN